MSKTEYKLSDTRALDLIWAYLELFPHWTPEERLENLRGLLRQTGRDEDYLTNRKGEAA